MIVFIELYYIMFLCSVSSWIAKILFPFPFSNVSRIKYSIIYISVISSSRGKGVLNMSPKSFCHLLWISTYLPNLGPSYTIPINCSRIGLIWYHLRKRSDFALTTRNVLPRSRVNTTYTVWKVTLYESYRVTAGS